MKLTYYTDAHVTLHHGDALDVLRALAYIGGWLVNGYVHLDDILTRPDGRAVLLSSDGSRNDLGESA